MPVTNHAVARSLDRFGPKVADTLLAKAAIAAATCPDRSAALLLARLPKMKGIAWGDASNGDDVWAIVRDGHVVTLMLRRSTQPATPSALHVAAVHIPSGLR
jgi:hypothetical protein